MNDTNLLLCDINREKVKSTAISSPADIKQICHIISALNLLKMNIGMYPESHASVNNSMDHAYTLIRDYFKAKSEINIGVTRKTLLFNENVLDKNNKNFQEYARVLNKFRVIFLKLKSTVTSQELFQFSKILSSKPSDIGFMDKLENLLAHSSIKGIEVKTIDTNYFQLTEKKNTRDISDEDFWQEFILRMTFDKSKMEFENYDARNPVHSGLMEIIHKINDNGQYWQKAVASYGKMIEDYLSERQANSHVSVEKHEILGAIANLINNFHPDLKEQLLNTAQRKLSLHAEAALTLENMNYLPDEMLPVIVQLANEKQKQISPALLMLLQRLSATGKSFNAELTDSGQNMTSLEMESILKKEKYEEYIPEKYDQLLKNLSHTSSADNAAEGFPLSPYLKTLDDEHINFSICKLVFALLEEETDEENYLAYSKRLALFIPDLLRTGQFSFLIGMIETFRRHGHQSTSEKIRIESSSVLSTLTAPETIAPNIIPIVLSERETTEMAKFLFMSGAQNIPWLFDLYLNPSTTACNTLIGIIKGFGNKAVEEASKRMKNQTQLKALRILAFLREIGNDSTIPLLKELYEYDDYIVKKEVLEILFTFNYSGAIGLLRKSLCSPNYKEIQQAVRLTVLYEISALMDELMSLLKTFYIPKKDAILNEIIARQLGCSGSSWAIPYLEMITVIRFTLSPQRLSHMKEILYESLENFPRQDVQLLLERGSKSWNRKIRESCLKIMKQKES